ncbi:MAG: fibronectin type III domain-containing protein [Verrucomicrobia bacterium]|nr:fibronectin type III domain-containing protein [Verrucomicrobiota bacterium]
MLALGAQAEKSVTLAWDPSPTPTVVGYTIQYGTNSGQYSEFLLLGNETTAVVPDLLEGITYYFVVTAHTEEGLESDPSNELEYTVPDGNNNYLPPSLNPLSDIAFDEGSGEQRVDLVGLASGLTSLLLDVKAKSSNPAIIPDPVVSLPGLLTGGYLTLASLPDANGTVTITVTVDNLQPLNNILVRTFTVTVYSENDPPTLGMIEDLTVDSTAGPQLISLTGITSGAFNESQHLSVVAESSEPEIVPEPQVEYTSPNETGLLRIDPVAYTNGSSIITVTVSDGQDSITRSFRVNVSHAEVTYFLEAESGSVQSPMVIAASTNASSGRYVYSQSSESGAVTFNLNASLTGNYVIWCRILSVNSSSDSFYISLDGGPETVYSTAQNIWSKTWQWTRINAGTSTDALLFPLGQGSHTLRFRAREQSTMLDSLYVTNDRDFVPVHLTLAKSLTEPNSVDLLFQTAAGFRYAIDTTTDFTNWATVWSVPTNIPLAQVIKYQDSTLSAPMRFYRVRVNP